MAPLPLRGIQGAEEEDLDEEIGDLEEEDDEEEEEEEEYEEEEEDVGGEVMRKLVSCMSSGPVAVRVHEVVIKGNANTRGSLIHAEVGDVFRSVTSLQELVEAAGVANARLQRLEIFDSVSITLDAGPPELPYTANVVVEVVEAKSPYGGDFGAYSRPGEAKPWFVELSLKLRNLFGLGDVWDASGIHGWNQVGEISTGVSLPRVKALPTPLMARVSLLTQDWLKFASYKDPLLGFSVGLVSTSYHDLAYNLTFRNVSDASCMPSKSIRSQLGESLLSSLKYTFKIDQRDSRLRPTHGYAFLSTSQIGGLGDSRFLRFMQQELDLRGAFPLGFYNTALNFGVAGGVILPLGRGFMTSSSPTSEGLHIGAQSSLACGLGWPISLLGFKLRGSGPTDPQRPIPRKSIKDDLDSTPAGDVHGGNLAITAFADLSFDLPLKFSRESGIHGHTFICAGNLTKLAGDAYKDFSFQQFLSSFRSSVGFGIVIPTKLLRMEVNYCYVLKQLQQDPGKTGIQFSFSSP